MFDPKWHIFELGLAILRTNILTKFQNTEANIEVKSVYKIVLKCFLVTLFFFLSNMIFNWI